MSQIGGRMREGCPLKPRHGRAVVRVAHALDRLVAVGVSVELEQESAAVAVSQLLGDHPRLELELVEHVAGAEVPELVEVELVLLVGGDPLAQMMGRRQARGKGAANRVPSSPLAFLAELVAALG